MTIETSRTVSQLRSECYHKGILIPTEEEEKVNRKEKYILLLRKYWLKRYYNTPDKIPWSLRFMLSIESPMLCKRYIQCKEEIRKQFWESDDYIVEEKINGVRCLIIYDAITKKLDFYSREVSNKDLLPVSYTNKIQVSFTQLSYPYSFVLDSEIKTKENSKLTSLEILSLIPPESINAQIENKLEFIVFDCLYNKESLLEESWEDRHKHVENLGALLQHHQFPCLLNPVSYQNKLEFYSDMIIKGREGIIIKSKKACYHANLSRTNDQVKLKVPGLNDLCKDVDAWVTGYEVNKFGENALIKALKFSCKIKKENGIIKEQVIGICTDLPYSLQCDATVYVNDQPTLNPDYFGRVATLSGVRFSAKDLTLIHCGIERWRLEKSIDSCEVLEESELRAQIV